MAFDNPSSTLIYGTVRYNLLAVNGDSEPSSLADALGDKNWKHAMDLEFSALEKNKTWHLVPYSHGENIVDCKWVFKIKRNPLTDIKLAWLPKGIDKGMALTMRIHLVQLLKLLLSD
jgi:hypothetical protein